MKHLFFPAMIAGVCILGSCGKTYNSGKGPFTDIQAALDSQKVSARTNIIDATAGGSFTNESGVQFVFPPNAFKNSAGDIVSGNVDISSAVYMKKSDMIFSKLYPVSNGQPLISGGEYFMRPSQNGVEL